MHIISIILPVFGVILLGYLARKFKILRERTSVVFNNFVYYFALPFLIFDSIAKADKSVVFNGKLLLTNFSALIGLIIVVWIILKLLKILNQMGFHLKNG